jgi:hypothetical protein
MKKFMDFEEMQQLSLAEYDAMGDSVEEFDNPEDWDYSKVYVPPDNTEYPRLKAPKVAI